MGQLLRYRTSPAESVTLAAAYEYDPYGNPLAVRDLDASGIAGENEIRFSTKWLEAQPGTGGDLYYYIYRYYSPGLGRWISRDPIGEKGGQNVLAAFGNSPAIRIDPVGKYFAAHWTYVPEGATMREGTLGGTSLANYEMMISDRRCGEDGYSFIADTDVTVVVLV